MSLFASFKESRFGRVTGAITAFLGLSVVAGILVGILMAPAAVASSSIVGKGTDAFNALPDYLKILPPDQYTTFYATKDGQQVPIAQFYYQNRIDVKWDGIAQTVKDAAVATEDPRFYSEGGVDLIGTLRGAASTVTGGGVQGGSSITQQYVKNVLVQRCESDYSVDPNASKKQYQKQQDALQACYDDAAGVSVDRKVQEIRYAMGVNKTYSKQQILLGYLNLVGFGGQVYGVEAAARYYYGVSAAQLDLNQSATLVAILNNPANLRIDQTAAVNKGSNPDNGFAATKDRRDYVLDQMVKEHKITRADATAAQAQPITPKITPTPSGCMAAQQYSAGFFCDYVQTIMLTDPAFGKTSDERRRFFQQGGMNVYTTLNLDLQSVAQTSMDSYIPHSTGTSFDLGAAQTSMEVGTGKVVTMLQNKEYNNTANPPATATSINYSTPYAYGGSSGFQTGSSFKPFVLADWLEHGHTLSEVVNGASNTFYFQDFKSTCGSDQPYSYGPFTVENDESWENGYRSVLYGTQQSINTVYMAMAEQLNLCEIHQVAKAMGVDSANPARYPWDPVPTSAIGTNAVSPLQMAQAYAGIANNGIVCTPIAINSITRVDDGSAVTVPKTTCTQGMPASIAAGVNYALQRVMTAGTGTIANPWDGTQIMGKTGTSNEARQNWIVTSTTKVAQATWVGNIDESDPVNLRTQTFTNTQTHQVIRGGDAKLWIAKPILKALDQVYPADPLPAASSDLIYGKYYTPPAPSSPSSTPSSTPSSAPSTAASGSPSRTPSKAPSKPSAPAKAPTKPSAPAKPNPKPTTKG